MEATSGTRAVERVKYGLQVISELEMERLRLFHFFSMTNHIIAKNLPGSSVSLSPTNLGVLTATHTDFERCFNQCVAPRALVARGGEFAAVSFRFAEMSRHGRGELLGRQYFYLSRPGFLGNTVGAFRLFMVSSDASKHVQLSFRNLGGVLGGVPGGFIDRGSSELDLSLMLSTASIKLFNGPSHFSLFYLTRKHTTR
mmetsp:Transcript_3950/g.11668  ORF Transcript_3950/g.11668 Transcript_3950/m.11668 type:complete len:198 (-) Transcript_3950:454-1047(-)